jgi:hypothetical protein
MILLHFDLFLFFIYLFIYLFIYCRTTLNLNLKHVVNGNAMFARVTAYRYFTRNLETYRSDLILKALVPVEQNFKLHGAF